MVHGEKPNPADRGSSGGGWNFHGNATDMRFNGRTICIQIVALSMKLQPTIEVPLMLF